MASERESLDLRSDRHLEEAVGFAVHDEVEELTGCRVDVVEELGRVFRVNVLASDTEMSSGHLRQRPGGRVDEGL